MLVYTLHFATISTDHVIFQELLNQGGPIKVFMFSYMKGGSTIGGSLFNVDDRAALWYEPLDAFYSAYFAGRAEVIPYGYMYWQNNTRRWVQ